MEVLVMNRKRASKFSYANKNIRTAMISITDPDKPDNMLRDYENWKSRPEIIGDGNIEQGAKMANPDGTIDMKYGVHGQAASWDIGGVHMEGGAGQMNTVFSWGTCRDSGIITNCGRAKID